MKRFDISSTERIDKSLQLLGIRRFALAVHDASFPSTPEEDIGRGSPYGRAGLKFLQFARSLGFNALQLGPQGKTSRNDPSPYNGCIFSKNILSLAALTLVNDDRLKGVFFKSDLEQLSDRWKHRRSETQADHADHAMAWEVSHSLLDLVYSRFRVLRQTASDAAAEFERFIAAQKAAGVNWFERDCVYEALTLASGADDWQLWGEGAAGATPLDRRLYCPNPGEEEACRRRVSEILRNNADAVERFAFGQFLLHLQHERMREETRKLGLLVYGDMHIGCSHQDWWAWRSLFLGTYLLGAPPSRTNPEGQPWGYPVFDPRKIRAVGPRGEPAPRPVLDFVRARADKLLAEFDGMRIDHPQGLVCPWVYRADDPDPFQAVRHGARLYSAPNFPDHPELRQFALVHPDQLNPDPNYPRYGDEQVRDLLPEQIERYGALLDAVLEAARSAGRRSDDILCEVLSTWPRPLKAVMMQRGMGRFCITQKADPHNPDDVYRPERTSANDWIMVGNHDTKPLWLVAEERKASDWMRDRSVLLAHRLIPEPERRRAFAERLASDHRRFCEAMFAELFLGPAQNVSVFFADLFGERRLYNQPGTMGEDNWRLRVPRDYEAVYAERLNRGEALDIRRVLALALEAKAVSLGEEAAALARQLRKDNDDTGGSY